MEEAAMGADASHLYSPAAMPIYEYRCENGHLFEVMQKITDDPVTACPEDGSPVQRVFHPIAVHFKGSGFYNTDYGTAKRKREMDRSASSGADKHDAKQAGKRDSKSSGDSGSSSSSTSSSDSSSSSGSSAGSGSPSSS
jgi:putative FmdB family regulatory protein